MITEVTSIPKSHGSYFILGVTQPAMWLGMKIIETEKVKVIAEKFRTRSNSQGSEKVSTPNRNPISKPSLLPARHKLLGGYLDVNHIPILALCCHYLS
jgi:hypothetical protein